MSTIHSATAPGTEVRTAMDETRARDKGATRRRAPLLAAPVVMMMLVVATALAAANPAGAATTRTVRGTVICAKGHAVTGVYVKSSAGGSKFASWFAMPGNKNAAYFTASISTSSRTTKVELHVGCGGTSSKWWSNNRTKAATVTDSRTLNARCTDSVAGTRQSCAWPLRGGSRTYNAGVAGNCTWLAYDEWKKVTGYYPALSGNAQAWDSSASAAGFQVSGVPHRRSIVVFEPGVAGAGPVGHVGWVRDVRRSNGKVQFLVREMNYGGLYKVNERWVTDGPGMSFIVATL